MRSIFGALAVLMVLAVAGALVIIYSGVINVAASEPHGPAARWILETARTQSVKRHAQAVQVPAGSRSSERGFAAYEEMCVACHGAPGAEPSALGKGLMPAAPDLAGEVEHWSTSELFWIVQNGIKMTGMPAWDATHSDEELWDVVAFLELLPSLSAEEYREMRDRLTDTPGHGHGHNGAR